MKNSKSYVVTGHDTTFTSYNDAVVFAKANGLDRKAVTAVATIVNQENVMNNDTPVTPEVIETLETITPEVIETIIAPVAETPAPVFTLIAPRVVRHGFETVLLAELAKGPGTTAELVDRMLASGEFFRVAPAAATKRPFKPTNFLLRAWTKEGMLTDKPVAPAVIEDAPVVSGEVLTEDEEAAA